MDYRWIAAGALAAALAVAAGATAAPAGNAEAGKELFSEQCMLCHSTTPTGGTGAGPDLNGVVGRAPGTSAGFTYTRALKAKTAPWTPETLDTFLTDPQAYAPGTSMPVNIGDAKDRADVIAYLQTVK
jgi:cytochrome c